MDSRLHTKGNAVSLIEQKASEYVKAWKKEDLMKEQQKNNLTTSVPRENIDQAIFSKSDEDKQKLKDLKKKYKQNVS